MFMKSKTGPRKTGLEYIYFAKVLREWWNHRCKSNI
jgi:hypothetical protein